MHLSWGSSSSGTINRHKRKFLLNQHLAETNVYEWSVWMHTPLGIFAFTNLVREESEWQSVSESPSTGAYVGFLFACYSTPKMSAADRVVLPKGSLWDKHAYPNSVPDRGRRHRLPHFAMLPSSGASNASWHAGYSATCAVNRSYLWSLNLTLDL